MSLKESSMLHRNGRPSAASEHSPRETSGRLHAVPDLPDELIADREVRHHTTIEASFDRAEAYERLGDFEHALEWLDRAAVISAGLPSEYAALRLLWARSAAG
jgi:tetratricopeptide (TPR) repeat protein